MQHAVEAAAAAPIPLPPVYLPGNDDVEIEVNDAGAHFTSMDAGDA